MLFKDYLSSFSIEDLRELAVRRRIPVRQDAARQTLVRTLTASLDRPDSVYSAAARLNQAELAVLHAVLQHGGKSGLTRLCRESGLSTERAKAYLESLRLYGLLFPEGDWEHIGIPNPTRGAAHYLPGRRPDPLEQLVALPQLETVPADGVTARPGSFSRDLAEYLGRLARGRFKVTQAGRMNRRDLKGMESAFGIPSPGYGMFLFLLGANAGLLGIQEEDSLLFVHEDVDALLGQEEAQRMAVLSLVWCHMRGYAESASGEPDEYPYLPVQLPDQRMLALSLLRECPSGQACELSSVVRAMVWNLPLSFQAWDSSRDATRVCTRLVRSLYWLGLAAVDDPEKPTRLQLTPVGRHATRAEDAPGLVPEETRFFVQPNAEVFAPPNLAPRSYFHLRRITGEKKGAPEGVFPLNAESVRRALDNGVTTEQILTFLERFSRTGLPGTVRNIVETTGRQHGRIRVVPAGYVLVTDDTQLLNELRNLKTVAPLLGPELTERSVVLPANGVQELMRTLRQRGYAPLNRAEIVDGPPLAEDPDARPEVPQMPTSAGGADLLGQFLSDAAELLGGDQEDLPPATTPAEIVSLLRYAAREEFWLEVEYQSTPHRDPVLLPIVPLRISGGTLRALVGEEEKENTLEVARILSARLIPDDDGF